MPSKRKFWRAVFEVEVLLESEEDPTTMLHNRELRYILADCEDGGYSGHVSLARCTEKSGKQMAQLLEAQGSEPEFFRLDTDGNDLEDQ